MSTSPDAHAPAPAPAAHAPGVLRLIAVAKLGKAALFLIAGIAISSLARHNEVQQTLETWLGWIHADPKGHFLRKMIEKIAGFDHDWLRFIGAGSFFYATLYSVEGFGLWYDRPWAEWLTIVGTSLLIPLELYELVENFGPAPVVALILNVVVVVYLWKRLRARARHLLPPPPGR